MPTTLRMFRGEEPMFATVNGSSTCTLWACFGPPFGPSKIFVHCAPCCATREGLVQMGVWSRPAHAKSTGPDEPANSSRHQRYYRPEKKQSRSHWSATMRSEHLFTLRQSLKAYRQYQQLISDCDREIQVRLETLPSKTETEQRALPPAKPSAKRRKGNESHRFPEVDWRMCETYLPPPRMPGSVLGCLFQRTARHRIEPFALSCRPSFFGSTRNISSAGGG